jgi:uncharacterized protein YdeI (YjbR/CyaY-like superfamily)
LDPLHFETAQEFRAWLKRHGRTATELWVGFYKKGSGRGGITYQEAVDEALCAGWIDGLKKRVDRHRYTHRFSPRKPKSAWSAVNLRRVRMLIRTRRMTAVGMRIFNDRDRKASGRSHQARPTDPDAATARALKAVPGAWAYFTSTPPWYRRLTARWVTSAKREATRARRRHMLVDSSARGEKIPAVAKLEKSRESNP